MTESNKSISPLRQRMIDDMTMRKLSPGTQRGYVRSVKRFVHFFCRSPDEANAEDLRRFQLHLAKEGVTSTSINQTLTGLRFFYSVTLSRPEVLAKVSHVHEEEKLPVILSMEEVTRLLEAAANLKHKAALSVAYGAGLRASEVVHLSSTDIDSERMLIRVEDRARDPGTAMPCCRRTCSQLLRAWWREGRAKQQLLPRGWLFPGRNPVNPMSTRQLNRAFHTARRAAAIDKPVNLHSLRHSFATHSARASRRHPGHPGPARTQEADHHRTLQPGRNTHLKGGQKSVRLPRYHRRLILGHGPTSARGRRHLP